ncbi:MAG: hypothetical protein K9M11_01060 [Candidatus Pacebacteria bacterium]|nr:hypothetical protein [Candidatus Paceibacterota bacterium]
MNDLRYRYRTFFCNHHRQIKAVPEYYDPQTENWFSSPPLNELPGIISSNPLSITEKVIAELWRMRISAYDAGTAITVRASRDELPTVLQVLRESTEGTCIEIFHDTER